MMNIFIIIITIRFLIKETYLEIIRMSYQDTTEIENIGFQPSTISYEISYYDINANYINESLCTVWKDCTTHVFGFNCLLYQTKNFKEEMYLWEKITGPNNYTRLDTFRSFVETLHSRDSSKGWLCGEIIYEKLFRATRRNTEISKVTTVISKQYIHTILIHMSLLFCQDSDTNKNCANFIFAKINLALSKIHTTSLSDIPFGSFGFDSYSKYFILITCNLVVKCPDNFYKENCWVKCQNTTRNNCSTSGDEICALGWNKIYTLYVIDNKDYQLYGRCLFYDRCQFDDIYDSCQNGSRCIPNENGSYACASFDFITLTDIENDSEPYVINDRTALIDEKVYFEIIPSPSNITSASYYLPYDLNNLYNGLDYLTITNKYFIATDNVYNGLWLNISIKVEVFNQYLTTDLFAIITFAKRPTKLFVVSKNITNNLYIYVGSITYCLSDGYPINILQHSLTIQSYDYEFEGITHNFSSTMKIIPFIPLTANLGPIYLSCHVLCDFKNGRPTSNISQQFYMTLKDYYVFYWIPRFEIIMFTMDYLVCMIDTMEINYINIYQSYGPRHIKSTISNKMKIDVEVGGYFGFVCNVRIHEPRRSYHIIKHVLLFKWPTDVCFQVFSTVPGSFIQCVADGYPNDLISYKMRLWDKRNRIVYPTSYIDYVKIPYFIQSNDFSVFCEATYEYANKNKTLTKIKEFMIQINSKLRVSFDESSLFCYNEASILDEDDAVLVGDYDVEFNKAIYYLKDPKIIKIGFIFPLICFINLCIIIVLCPIFIVFIYQLLELRDLTIRKINKIHSRCLYYREINDLLLTFTRIYAAKQNLELWAKLRNAVPTYMEKRLCESVRSVRSMNSEVSDNIDRVLFKQKLQFITEQKMTRLVSRDQENVHRVLIELSSVSTSHESRNTYLS